MIFVKKFHKSLPNSYHHFFIVLEMILPNNIDTVWVEETRMHRHKHTRSTQITWKFEKGRGEKGTQEEKEDAH